MQSPAMLAIIIVPNSSSDSTGRIFKDDVLPTIARSWEGSRPQSDILTFSPWISRVAISNLQFAFSPYQQWYDDDDDDDGDNDNDNNNSDDDDNDYVDDSDDVVTISNLQFTF